ncbi:MAG: alpha/beta hydrolase [Verrucomicrobiota bacterium]
MSRPLLLALLLGCLQPRLLGAGQVDGSFGLLLDLDRDGFIAMGEGSGTDQPFHWWINDDDDEGDWQAGKDTPRLGPPDWSTPRIDGLRDLVDFFPVFLDCGFLYRMNGLLGSRYEVRCQGGGLEAYAVGLSPEDAGGLHRLKDQKLFGEHFDLPLEEAEPMGLASGQWVHLSVEHLYRLSVEQVTGAAMLIMEGRKAGRFVLELRVTTAAGEVHLSRRTVVIAHVETMYRELMTGDGVSRLGEPRGLPDAGLARGWTVFVHGYNVPPQAARGWNAEMFKRLHALGSRRKFVGVHWPGATGLDYHAAVQRALHSGRSLGAQAAAAIRGGQVVLIAHSLGNVVAGEAVARGGWKPDKYYMVNAAVPAEAYTAENTDPSHAFHMTDARWRGYDRRLHASSWHALFPAHDYRSRFGWSGAFSDIPLSVQVINAYSEGEDVTNCPEEVDSASLLSALVHGRDFSDGVWKTQELLKGVPMTRSLGTLFMRRSQAGWDFNERWRGRYVPNGFREPGGYHRRMTPDEAARITDEQLRTQPFFSRFLWVWLHDRRPRLANGSQLEFAMFTDVLARGVPARSYAAGCHAMAVKLVADLNLESEGRIPAMGWPQDGHEGGKKAGRWLHSDFRNAALPYVHPFFKQLSQ